MDAPAWIPGEGLFGLLSAGVMGLLVGFFFFGTLWWTVRRLRATAHPHALLFGSFLVRAAAVVGVFYWLAAEGPWAIVPAALGFLIARSLLVRRLGPPRSAGTAAP